MAARSVNLGGFRVSIEVPDQVRKIIRKVSSGRSRRQRVDSFGPPTPRLILREPPLAQFVRRDSDVGLAFIRHRLVQRAPDLDGGVPDDERGGLAREVAAHPWYHTIELPHGVVTPGEYDHRGLVASYGIPPDLRGQRVLDVGTADGFWAFEFERRGAEVTAVDIESTAEVDLPQVLKVLAAERGYDDPLGDGFELAHRALQSSVKRVPGTIYNLDANRLGRFDLVHCGDLLVHVREPTRALEQLRSVTSGFALISDVFDPAIGWPERDEAGLSRYLGGWVSAGWWAPALGTLVQMVADAGFDDVEVVTVYNLAPGCEPEGPWRAVLRARP